MKVLCSGEVYFDPIETESCLACAYSKRQPPCGYSYPILKAMFFSQEGDSRAAEVHVTDLTRCLLQAYLDKVDPQPKYVHELLVLTIGVALQKYAEWACATDHEIRVEVPVSDAGIVGRIDFLYPNGDIEDLKTTRWLEGSYQLPYGNHSEQINTYANIIGSDGNLYVSYVDVTGPPRCQKYVNKHKCNSMAVMQDGVIVCPTCQVASPRQHLGSKVVEAKHDPGMYSWMKERAQLLALALQTKTAPEAEPGWGCAYCLHVKSCTIGSIYMEAK